MKEFKMSIGNEAGKYSIKNALDEKEIRKSWKKKWTENKKIDRFIDWLLKKCIERN